MPQISQLPAATVAEPSDEVPVTQDGVTQRETVGQINAGPLAAAAAALTVAQNASAVASSAGTTATAASVAIAAEVTRATAAEAALSAAIPAPSSASPQMDGTAAPGSSAALSRGDHVHPTDTSRYAAANPAGYQTAAQVAATLASPPAIGATTPAAVTATTLTLTGSVAQSTVLAGPSGASGAPTRRQLGVADITGAAESGANSSITSLTGLTTPLALAKGGTGGTSQSSARSGLGAAASGANSDITSLNGLTTPLAITEGGIGANSAASGRVNLGAAASGPNSDITSLTGLTTPLGIGEGGTGAISAAAARTALTAAASGANTDITSLSAPALGAATATTQAATDNSTKVATTAFNVAALAATLASPPAIGSTAPAAGAFSSLTSSGPVTITDPSTNNQHTLTISATSSTSGAGIELIGNGATTPNKYLRAISGQFQIVNSAYAASIFILDDAGNQTLTGSLTTAGPIQAAGGIKSQVSGTTSGSYASHDLVTGTANSTAQLRLYDGATPTLYLSSGTAVTGGIQISPGAGPVVLNDPQTAATYSLGIVASSNADGAAIKLTGSGGSKYLRVAGNNFSVVSSNYGTSLLYMDDSGNTLLNGSLGTGGPVTITDPSTNNLASLVISATSDGNGAAIKLVGNGSTTPNKYLRAVSGIFQMLNSAYTAPILTVDDSGNMVVPGALTVGAPVTITSLATSGSAVIVSNTTNTSGVNIQLTGNGSTTPNKFLSVVSGIFHVCNSSYSVYLLSLDDAGNFSVTGGITAVGSVVTSTVGTSSSTYSGHDMSTSTTNCYAHVRVYDGPQPYFLIESGPGCTNGINFVPDAGPINLQAAHVVSKYSGSAPTASVGSISSGSTDFRGAVSINAGTTSTTITFSSAFPSAPFIAIGCNVAGATVSSITTTGFTLGLNPNTTGATINWVCVG